MSNEFQTYKLSELTTIVVGGDLPNSYSTEKTNHFTVPVYSNGEKENGLYGYTDIPEVTEPAVTISARGSKVGFAALRKEPFLPIVRLISLIPHKEKLDVNFLFYNLKLNRQSGIGSGQPQITIPDISNRTISVPPLPTQQKIASVLSALDDKIELNNRINTELEAMAKTIYDYWFVQFDFPDANGKPYKSSGGKMVYNDVLKREVPEGWSVGTLEDLGSIIGGSTPSREVTEYFSNNGTAWITPKDLSLNTGNKYITKGELDVTDKGIKAASLTIMPANTILLSSRAPIGYLAISRTDVTTNQGFKSFVTDKGFSAEFVYYTIKNMIPVIENNAVGSTFKEVSGTTLKSLQVCLPDKSIIDQYNEKVKPIFKRQDVAEQENQQLSQLRDWLLPMLMNGQVSVAHAYRQAAQALSMAAEDAAGYRKGK